MRWLKIFRKNNNISHQTGEPISEQEEEDSYHSISPDKRWSLRANTNGKKGILTSFHDGMPVFDYSYKNFAQIPLSARLSNAGVFCFAHCNKDNCGKYIETSTVYICSDSKVRKIILEGSYNNCGISDDGTVCCALGFTIKHERNVTLFSTQDNEQIGSFSVDEYKLTNIYEINPGKRLLTLSSPTLGTFSFTYLGQICSESSYIHAELSLGSLIVVCERVKKILKAIPAVEDPAILSELLIRLDRAPAEKFSEERWNMKSLLETKILVLERMKYFDEALQCASMLAEVFPTIANKKKVNSLKNRKT